MSAGLLGALEWNDMQYVQGYRLDSEGEGREREESGERVKSDNTRMFQNPDMGQETHCSECRSRN